MTSATRSSTDSAASTIVSLDVGTSSVRTLLFDAQGQAIAGFGEQLPWRVITTADGGVEADPEELLRLCVQALNTIHQQMEAAGKPRPDAVAFCAFWHSFLGVDQAGQPTTNILHLFDTRSVAQVEQLKKELSPAAVHARVGAVFHTSYWPGKLLWLASQGASADCWMSFSEFLYLRLFGVARASTSMASGSGLWNQNTNCWDEELLSYLALSEGKLATPDSMDEPLHELRQPWKQQWPLFAGIPWFPAIGDGAANNIGSGCLTRDRFALMVGTTAVMRAVAEQDRIDIPAGVWCYRIDRRRFVMGGAMNEGGEVYNWMRTHLHFEEESAALEARLAARQPGSHGLTMLPLFAGERSTKWRGDARATITGMSLHTQPIDILAAALESVALRFRQLYDLMEQAIGQPKEVVASGGALLNSPAWTQMMAGALHRPVLACLETETSSRGAAILALEAIGAVTHLRDVPARTGTAFLPQPADQAAWDKMLAQQKDLYSLLYERS
jgi:gluconokinase